MKYTDQWFKVPVKVYDGMEYEKALKREMEDDAPKEDIPWAKGYCRIRIEDIVSWQDVFVRPKTAFDGCNATLILMKNGDDIVCTWDRVKFEEKLDEYDVWTWDTLEREALDDTDDNDSITDETKI